ncbi:hypothetical protein [Egicoccus halophilus]|uniref:Uncharacterized protein n=1 Tax=Egicoccus halophilus TaxID=1670830 RepID=A0A8J3EV21_9ACTN|nr:hypothetical protein [Egicoccus halophilus]GGI08807.1 hypothetical protein GCM10011354_30930 [Egicoccus halophilus]
MARATRSSTSPRRWRRRAVAASAPDPTTVGRLLFTARQPPVAPRPPSADPAAPDDATPTDPARTDPAPDHPAAGDPAPDHPAAAGDPAPDHPAAEASVRPRTTVHAAALDHRSPPLTLTPSQALRLAARGPADVRRPDAGVGRVEASLSPRG